MMEGQPQKRARPVSTELEEELRDVVQVLSPEDMAHRTKAQRLSIGTALQEYVDFLPTVTEKKSVAVLTSGGDAQGMNSALRAIVRLCLHNGVQVYAVHEGYQGLVDGGEAIEECQWNSVSNILHRGGTVIGTARCKDFRERQGRLKAAENLVMKGIGNLVVIGGDGSLTGASVFKEEWSGLLVELQQANRISVEEAEICSYLNIVGLVGSIDNDMCGTDMTIGTDSALHRIIEAVDCLTSTAASHQRSFVLEVMGRHCGYLAQMAAIAGRADWVLIPEKPPSPGWQERMCSKVQQCRNLGQRLNIVIVSEGAVDMENKPITSQDVKEVIETKLGHDTRITVLGHVQRGGKPSAYDRLIACRMGAAGALVLLRASGEIPPTMIGVQGNYICQIPLMECVQATHEVNRAMKECNFERAQALRGGSFLSNLYVSRRISACGPRSCRSESPNTTGPSYRVAVMNVGSPAAGMNSSIRAFVRLMTYSGHTVIGIEEGFEGLLLGRVREMGWHDVSEWASAGGSNLGTNRTEPTEETISAIAEKLTAHRIQGLLIVGGFDGFESLVKLQKHRERYPAFQIPMLGIAATVSNNVPGTDYSLGSDTALNTIVSMCDVLRQSANASRKRVFVVQTMGGYCGYLATMAGLAAGADTSYIFEEKFTISDMHNDVARLAGKFTADGVQRGIITRSERCSVNFTSDFMCQLLSEEGRGVFVTESNVLGHLQQGDSPSPYDRILGTKYAAHAVDFFLKQMKECLVGCEEGELQATTPQSVCMVGIRGTSMVTTPIRDLIKETDFVHRIPKSQWWMSLRGLLHVLARDRNHVFLGEEHLKSMDTT